MNKLGDDPRFGDLIRSDVASAQAGDVVIVGVPTDEGVRRNGGRVGAAQAPDEIRKYLRKIALPLSMYGDHQKQIFDHGNISGATLEEIHDNACAAAATYSRRGCFVIGLGGGHDVTYPLVKGHREAGAPFGLMNIDAHLDVRQKKNGLHHSGSSFRLLIEEGIVSGTDFVEFGIQPLAAAKAHADWVTDQGGHIHYLYAIQAEAVERNFGIATAALESYYLSFDIDSVRASDAPGCSAPSPVGFTAEEALAMCAIAAASGKLRGFDIVETNPLFDIDGHTSRLAAMMIATVIASIPQ
ncbi:MAG: formimidoylglutamase [Bacteroidetes bacterium]|nr:formimidoylglutamase [Bacteroidota bacterium]